ncbi:MucBP domain-containing protein [Leuconostoc citreum]
MWKKNITLMSLAVILLFQPLYLTVSSNTSTLSEVTESSSDQKLTKDSESATTQQSTGISKSKKNLEKSIDSWMPDKSLQTEVAKKLGFNDVNMITKDNIKKLTYLSFSEKTGSLLYSLSGLEFATNLYMLYIPKSEVTDIKPLSKCKVLTQLYLMDSKINNITPLKSLNNLSNLHLDSNPFTDYSPIAGLTNIEEFGSRHNHIKNISFLNNWNNLKTLYLWHNDIIDIAPISKLSNLKTLELSYNNINDSSLLINFPPLTKVYLDGNNISDVNPLSDINSVQYLSIFGNHISNISPLSKLSSLGTLYAGNQTISLNKVSVEGNSYIQESSIKSIDGTLISLLADSKDEKGVNVDKGIEWTNLQDTGTFNATWTDKGTSFSGRIVLPYVKKTVAICHVTTKYVDEKGNKIADDVVKTGNMNDIYTTEQMSIDGYTFKEVRGNATGKFTDTAQTVTYVYTKDPVKGSSVTVKYVDEQGHSISDNAVLNGNLGESYQTEQKSIAGYTFKEVQGQVSGKYSDQAQTITYVYTKDVVKPANPTRPNKTNKPVTPVSPDNTTNKSQKKYPEKIKNSWHNLKQGNVTQAAQQLLPSTAVQKAGTSVLGIVILGSLAGTTFLLKNKKKRD